MFAEIVRTEHKFNYNCILFILIALVTVPAAVYI